MTIIDSHAHLKHGDARGTEYSPDEIIRAMDGAGIARSVVFAMSTTAERAIEMAAAAARRHPERLIPYAYGLPAYDRPVVDLIERAVSELGFRGIKMHTGESSVAEHVAGPVFELAARLDVPCLIDFGGRLGACQQVLARHPDTTIIICHLGRYLSRDETLIDEFIGVAEEHPNALLDASGVALSRKIEQAVARVGQERVLFGTDGPHSSADGPPYEAPTIVDFCRRQAAQIQQLDLSSAAKDAILGGNIARLLGL